MSISTQATVHVHTERCDMSSDSITGRTISLRGHNHGVNAYNLFLTIMVARVVETWVF